MKSARARVSCRADENNWMCVEHYRRSHTTHGINSRERGARMMAVWCPLQYELGLVQSRTRKPASEEKAIQPSNCNITVRVMGNTPGIKFPGTHLFTRMNTFNIESRNIFTRMTAQIIYHSSAHLMGSADQAYCIMQAPAGTHYILASCSST